MYSQHRSTMLFIALATLLCMPSLMDSCSLGTSSATGQTISHEPNAASEILLGNTYTHAERWPEAIEAYKRAIELDHRAAAAYGNLGHAHLL